MDKQTRGAWIVHHGRKVASAQNGAAEFSAIDVAAKSASLLARLAETAEASIGKGQVEAVARAGGLNPKTELPACLQQLKARRLIDVAQSGAIAVVGINGRTALTHASDIFDDNDPQPIERAAIALAEVTSTAPVGLVPAREYVSDHYKLGRTETSDFLAQASAIGFVDAEGEGNDRLFFNGNLFRRDTASKTKKVLDSLSSEEQTKVTQFTENLRTNGAVPLSTAERMLGADLLSKLRAAAVFDVNVISNEAGEHALLTSPGAFHKFTNPMVDDAFDHAKALVAALKYGMSQSSTTRGRIWGIDLLLGKLIRGLEVGPAPAIGNDYRALEFERVVQIRRDGSRCFMRLLKTEIGEIALQVLQGGNASAAALELLPSAGMAGYTPPEETRADFRKKKQTPRSKTQMQTLLSAVRSGTSL